MLPTSTDAPAGDAATTASGSYEVHTPVYEGPFDLLLHLILRDQVDLYEITLTEIVDAYLFELERMDTLDLEIATEFLLIAATLVELKSRRLLPGDDDLDLDDELALWEERDLLLARLLECKTFKDASVVLARLASEAGRSSPRTAGMEERFLAVAPALLAGVTAEALRDACLRALTPKPQPRIDLTHVAPIRMSVAEAVEELMEELPRMGTISFRSLTQSFVERLEVVLRFLAILEMFKQGWVELDQVESFGDIRISWIGAVGEDEPGGVTARLAAIDDYEG